MNPTPSFEASDSHIFEHSSSSEGAKFEDAISVAASLFSVASIDNALSMADIGTESPPSRDKAILNLNDVHSGSIKSKVPQKEKYFDDQSVASTITDATSLIYGFSQSMSEDGISHSMSQEDFTNETKHFLSRCGAPSQLPTKQEIRAGSTRADRRRRRSLSTACSAPQSSSSLIQVDS